MKSLRGEVDAIRKQLQRQGRGQARQQSPQEKRLAELLAYLAETDEPADLPDSPPLHLADMEELWEYRDVLAALLAEPIRESQRQAALEDEHRHQALCALTEWAAHWTAEAGKEEQSPNE